MILDRVEAIDRYAPLHPAFPKAFSVLRDPSTISLPDGRHEIDGDRIIVILNSYSTKPREPVSWESHRRYIDIQAVIHGEEICGWAPTESLNSGLPYDSATDYASYTGSGFFFELRTGIFAIFFPDDGHAPGLSLPRSSDVRKLVIKVKDTEEIAI